MKFKNKLFPMIVCPAWIPELNSVEHGPEGKERCAMSPRREGLGCWGWVPWDAGCQESLPAWGEEAFSLPSFTYIHGRVQGARGAGVIFQYSFSILTTC